MVSQPNTTVELEVINKDTYRITRRLHTACRFFELTGDEALKIYLQLKEVLKDE